MSVSVGQQEPLGVVDGATLDPPYYFPSYRSTLQRAPSMPLVAARPESAGRTGPVFGEDHVRHEDSDLTRRGAGAPIGERIIVHGRVTDSEGHPVAGQLVELWQANAAGRYAHVVDQHDAPLDPNFTGAGRCLTSSDGSYSFTTVRPGEYPWGNHANAWRPAHLHFSFFGRTFTSRLVTQMYFPGDPLLPLDPMFTSIRDREAAERLIGVFDLDATVESYALGYRFDVVLGPGRGATPIEEEHS